MITLNDACRAIAAAKVKAQEIGKPINVAVVEATAVANIGH